MAWYCVGLDISGWNRLDDVRAFNHTHGDAAYAEAPLRPGRLFGWRHHVAEHSFEPQLTSPLPGSTRSVNVKMTLLFDVSMDSHGSNAR